MATFQELNIRPEVTLQPHLQSLSIRGQNNFIVYLSGVSGIFFSSFDSASLLFVVSQIVLARFKTGLQGYEERHFYFEGRKLI